MNKKEIIYVYRSLLSEILIDIVSYSTIFAMLYFNHKVLAGHWLIDAFFILICFLSVVSKVQTNIKKFYSKDELIKYLQDNQ